MRTAVFITALATAGLLAACGGKSTPTAYHTPSLVPSTAATQASSGSSSSSCQQQAYTWGHSGGGATDMGALGIALDTLTAAYPTLAAALESGGDTTAALTGITTDAGNLATAANNALANLPPSCIPGEVGPFRKAMNDALKSSRATIQAVADIAGGDMNSGARQVQLSTAAIDAAGREIRRATAAIDAFNTSSG